jgi:hypothetical protein
MHNYTNLTKYVKRNMQLPPTSNTLSTGSLFPLTSLRPLKKVLFRGLRERFRPNIQLLDGRQLSALHPNPQAGEQPHVSCPRLLSFLHSEPENALSRSCMGPNSGMTKTLIKPMRCLHADTTAELHRMGTNISDSLYCNLPEPVIYWIFWTVSNIQWRLAWRQ